MTLTSIAVVVLETVPSLRVPPHGPFQTLETRNSSSAMSHLANTMPCGPLLFLEYITIAFLTIELMLRFAFSPQKKRFFLNILNILDVVTLLPSYAIIIIILIAEESDDLESLRQAMVILGIVRIIRIFRLFHLAKTYQTVQMIGVSMTESSREMCFTSCTLNSRQRFLCLTAVLLRTAHR